MKREFLRPLLITIILIAVYQLGTLLPIPFLNAEGIKGQFGASDPYIAMHSDLSIFMLGIMPYVSAYILVEIFSLFIPFLKRLRSGDFKGRLKLKRISLVLALALAIYQANALVSSLKNTALSNGNLILNVSNTFEHVFLVCVLVCSFCLLVALCELISRFGIGHGISIIILSGICGKFISRLPMYLAQFGYDDISSLIIPLIVICGLIAFAYVLLKTKISIPCYHEKDNTTVDYFQLNLAPSSRVALTYAAFIIILPLTLSSFSGTESSLANNLHPGSLGYQMISVIFVIMFSYLFGWAFLHPRKRVSKMQARGWHIANMDTTAESFMLKRQFIYNLPWTIFLCLMVIVPSTLIATTSIPFYIGGGSIPVIVAITLDLIDGFKFYQKDLLHPIKIAEFHDIYDANMIQNHMEALGIKSYLRGYHHRLLYYFFGPYIDMSLIIDDQDKERAQELIQDYYGGLGLAPNKQI
jgi:Preprotein translocase subunit SecY